MKKILRVIICKISHPFAKIGKGSYAAPSSTLGYGSVVGQNSYLAKGTIISNTIVGNYCSIAPNALLGLGEHDLSSYSTSLSSGTHHASLLRDKTVLGSDVWIGAGVVVRAGVKVGHGAVIGANSVVTKDVEPYSVVVGSPGRVIKLRFDQQQIDLLLQSQWWNFEPKLVPEIFKRIEKDLL